MIYDICWIIIHNLLKELSISWDFTALIHIVSIYKSRDWFLALFRSDTPAT